MFRKENDMNWFKKVSKWWKELEQQSKRDNYWRHLSEEIRDEICKYTINTNNDINSVVDCFIESDIVETVTMLKSYNINWVNR